MAVTIEMRQPPWIRRSPRGRKSGALTPGGPARPATGHRRPVDCTEVEIDEPRLAALGALDGRREQLAEERVGTVRPALELGVGLGPDPERVVGVARRTRPGARRERCPSTPGRPPRAGAVAGVDLVAVAVALGAPRPSRRTAGTIEPPARASPGTRRAAWCRPCRPRPAARPSGRSPGGECRSRTPSSWPAQSRPGAGRCR